MIYAGKETEVLVQGATGSQGRFHINLMNEYAKAVGGAGVTAGMTPGKGGQDAEGAVSGFQSAFAVDQRAVQTEGGHIQQVHDFAQGHLMGDGCCAVAAILGQHRFDAVKFAAVFLAFQGIQVHMAGRLLWYRKS